MFSYSKGGEVIPLTNLKINLKTKDGHLAWVWSAAKHSSSFLRSVGSSLRTATPVCPSPIAGLRNTSSPVTLPRAWTQPPRPWSCHSIWTLLLPQIFPDAISSRVRTRREGDDVPSTRGPHSVLAITWPRGEASLPLPLSVFWAFALCWLTLTVNLTGSRIT